MTNNSHPEQCQCSDPGCTKTTNLGASHKQTTTLERNHQHSHRAGTCHRADDHGIIVL